MNKVVLLYGKPSTGKLTIANHIREQLQSRGRVCHVFDNHFFNDIVFPYVNVTKYLPKICESVYKIREIFLDTLANCSDMQDTTMVFTNVLIDSDDDRDSVRALKEFAKKLNAEFYLVQVVAGDDCILDWCDKEDRKKKQKLTDKDAMKSFITKTKFMTIEDSFVINNVDKDNTMKIVDNFVENKLC